MEADECDRMGLSSLTAGRSESLLSVWCTGLVNELGKPFFLALLIVDRLLHVAEPSANAFEFSDVPVAGNVDLPDSCHQVVG